MAFDVALLPVLHHIILGLEAGNEEQRRHGAAARRVMESLGWDWTAYDRFVPDDVREGPPP